VVEMAIQKTVHYDECLKNKTFSCALTSCNFAIIRMGDAQYILLTIKTKNASSFSAPFL
jgi:hypothetical protein